ncbi:tryptophan dimethylallyltransferase family protein [Actinocatenispora comari]|uniref:Prenyltransferase n=1 Tax=Actinocatenispora comari TaxID=2807577 RepID=A0A8J4AIV3_9ACTN|nr:tryptophan dimethylallyltransferase family protein [Actinocatenispora comari]GIL32071.1 prenyltransferase [Actinocatenispora comari]
MDTSASSSLSSHVSTQAHALMTAAGYDNAHAVDELLADLLTADETTTPWPSQISDDHTPVEFSLALDHGQRPTVRILAEALAARPSLAANLHAAQHLLERWASRYSLAMGQYQQVADLFAGAPPDSQFAVWFSVVLRRRNVPRIKVYLNPQCRGTRHSVALVVTAMRRLGLGGAYPALQAAAIQPGGRYSFLALDLHHGPRSRIKVYASHAATATDADAARAAAVVPGVDTDEVTTFCRLAAGDTLGSATSRPLVSSYTFVDGDSCHPSGYSLYVPIRSHVTDDRQARDRAIALARRYGHDAGLVDEAITAIARRDLAAGVGLIPHIAVRLGDRAPGLTVYLSSEAYRVSPPRPRTAFPPMSGPTRPERSGSSPEPR